MIGGFMFLVTQIAKSLISKYLDTLLLIEQLNTFRQLVTKVVTPFTEGSETLIGNFDI
jgi:hypothetical protein